EIGVRLGSANFMMNIETIRRAVRQSHVRLTLAIAAVIALAGGGSSLRTQAQSNPIVSENTNHAGTPGWDISGSGDPTIQGFATDISVNTGQIISFKIDSDSANYHIEIFRLGYYGGVGARRLASFAPSAPQPQNQPACLTDATSGLIDCGNWAVSASW